MITLTTVVTTMCIVVTSFTVIAAPMKQNGTEGAKKLSLPGAGINKVVSNYAEIADEADVKELASVIEAGSAADNGEAEAVEIAAKSAGKAVEFADTQLVMGEISYEEPVYEEEYLTQPLEAEISYEEPVYEEAYEEEAYSEDAAYAEDSYEEPGSEEEIYYEPETFLDEVFAEEEPAYEEDYAEEEYYEEPVYEEETLEEFLEEQEQQYEEETTAKKKKKEQTSDASLGQTIANDACQYVGWLPYVWAGDSLETGADCSGFTMAVYAKYGIYLSHDSEVQSCEGRSVPLSEAQPGDIVVYSGHVAMYIGNGQIVHSPTPGQCVSIASVYMMPVLDVRRMIG